MRINPVKLNLTSFGKKQEKSSYDKDLDALILKEYGNIFIVHDQEDYEKFIKATRNFKKENYDLLQKHFNVLV